MLTGQRRCLFAWLAITVCIVAVAAVGAVDFLSFFGITEGRLYIEPLIGAEVEERQGCGNVLAAPCAIDLEPEYLVETIARAQLATCLAAMAWESRWSIWRFPVRGVVH
jgi:hypothetical protein